MVDTSPLPPSLLLQCMQHSADGVKMTIGCPLLTIVRESHHCHLQTLEKAYWKCKPTAASAWQS